MLKPVDKNILLEAVEEKSVVELPDSLKKRQLFVYAVADDSKYKKGQGVVLRANVDVSGIKDGEKELLLVQESDIACIREEAKKKK